MTTHDNADYVIPTWHGNVCYHQRREVSRDMLYGAWTKVACPDCGAEAKAAYGCALPDLPPMPIDATGKVANAR